MLQGGGEPSKLKIYKNVECDLFDHIWNVLWLVLDQRDNERTERSFWCLDLAKARHSRPVVVYVKVEGFWFEAKKSNKIFCGEFDGSNEFENSHLSFSRGEVVSILRKSN